MQDLDIPTILFAILAIVVAFKLRSILGARNGAERPPTGPAAGPANSNVVRMPTAARVAGPAQSEIGWKGVAEPGTPLAAGLAAIAQGDRSFNGPHFLAGARAAYEMIVTAFAAGDLATLRGLLAGDVYDNFAQAIAARASAGQSMTTKLTAIDAADIVDAQVVSGQAQVAVRFNAKLISATRDNSGAVIEGSAEAPEDHVDIWTFSRTLGASDPNWSLSATQTVH
jgi:predicted lipid-binding transport protein (Tim44 family)